MYDFSFSLSLSPPSFPSRSHFFPLHVPGSLRVSPPPPAPHARRRAQHTLAYRRRRPPPSPHQWGVRVRRRPIATPHRARAPFLPRLAPPAAMANDDILASGSSGASDVRAVGEGGEQGREGRRRGRGFFRIYPLVPPSQNADDAPSPSPSPASRPAAGGCRPAAPVSGSGEARGRRPQKKRGARPPSTPPTRDGQTAAGRQFGRPLPAVGADAASRWSRAVALLPSVAVGGAEAARNAGRRALPKIAARAFGAKGGDGGGPRPRPPPRHAGRVRAVTRQRDGDRRAGVGSERQGATHTHPLFPPPLFFSSLQPGPRPGPVHRRGRRSLRLRCE